MQEKLDEIKEQYGMTILLVVCILVIAIVLGISFLFSTFLYWLALIVLNNFFGMSLVFSWDNAIGVWLLLVIIRSAISGIKVNVSK
jgi:hypothetical protein